MPSRNDELTLVRRRLLGTAALGACVVLAERLTGLLPVRANLLVALGAAVVVPLGLAATLRAHAVAVGAGAASLAVGLGAPCAALSFATTHRALSMGLAATWLIATLVLAAVALARLGRRGAGPLEELAIDVGHLYLPVGAVWLLASRAGVELLGFREPIVTYTANHFHFAGFAAPVIAGLAGRALPLRAPIADTRPSARWAALLRFATTVVIIGVPLTAAGILLSPELEAPAAVLLGSGMLVLALCLAKIGLATHHTEGWAPRLGGALLLVSAASLLLSMSFAVAFATTGSAARGAALPWVSFEHMEVYHGLANAFGFGLAGAVGLLLIAPPCRHRCSDAPLPRILSAGFVGPHFFDPAARVDPSVLGQVSSLEQLANPSFAPSLSPPAVRDFYERTSAYRLVARPRWSLPFRWFAPLAARAARGWLGNLELPLHPERSDTIHTRLFGLSDAGDPRPGARAYVRSYREQGRARANFVASYAVQSPAGEPRLVALFPLPRACLVAVLRFESCDRGLVVTSRAPEGEPCAGEGMFLTTKALTWRLPLDEQITVIATDDGRLSARHETTLFGLRCFEIDYGLERHSEDQRDGG